MLNNNYFQQTDDFFRIVIKAIIIALYIYMVSYSTISKLQTWIGRSNWAILISIVTYNHLGILKVYDIQDKASQTTPTTIASMLNAKKRARLEFKDNQ